MEYLVLRHSIEDEKRRLFCLLGEYFASAALRREFGRPMSSDDNHVWFLALDGKAVAAFASLHIRKSGSAELCHAYTNPEYRRQGLNTELTRRRIEWARESGLVKVLVTTVDPSREHRYVPHGFRHHRRRGRWAVFTREIA